MNFRNLGVAPEGPGAGPVAGYPGGLAFPLAKLGCDEDLFLPPPLTMTGRLQGPESDPP